MVQIYNRGKVEEMTKENLITGIAGETVFLPNSNSLLCRTTITSYKKLADSSYPDYHPFNLKNAYETLTGCKIKEDICMLISNGYIYMFPESKDCIEDNYNNLLIAPTLFEKENIKITKTP